MGVWGWIGLLVVLWEKWGGPYGRVGPGAYLMAGAQGEVYLGEGRWVWRLSGGRWESVGLLPGEGRTGAVDAEGRLWIAGLNSLYFQKERHTHTLPLPQAGWGEMLWQLPSGIAIRGTSRSFWIPYSPQLKAYPLPGGKWPFSVLFPCKPSPGRAKRDGSFPARAVCIASPEKASSKS